MDRPVLIASLLLTALTIGLVWEFIGEAPPDRVRIAAGPRDGGYYAFANLLAQRVRRHGVAVEVLETDGAVDNLALMSKSGGPVLGLVQGGTRPGPGVDTSQLRTLATVDLEPVWIFQRASEPQIRSLQEFEGKAIIGGRVGSGTHDLLELLIEKAGVSAEISALSNTDAERALIDGRGDILFSVARWQGDGWVSDLLKTKAVTFVELEEISALDRILPFLASLTIPRGAIDIRRPHPDENVQVLATATNLVVHRAAHPATKALFLEELKTIDHGTRLLGTDGQFPSLKFAELPVDTDAARIFKDGQTFFHRYLPYWLAAEVERFYALLLPLATLVFPLWRLVPRWIEKRRHDDFDRLQHKLQEIDLAISSADHHPAEMRIHFSRLKHFERDLTLIHRRKLKPAEFGDLRRDIDRLRTRAQRTLDLTAPEPATAPALQPVTTVGLADTETAGPAKPSSTEHLLTRLQADLDDLAHFKRPFGSTVPPDDFNKEVAAMRAHLARARRALLHVPPASPEPTSTLTPDEPASHAEVVMAPGPIAQRVIEITMTPASAIDVRESAKDPVQRG